MEDIAAVGLASNIAQFAEYAIAVVSWTLEISQTSKLSPRENHYMEEALTDMKDIVSKLLPSSQAASASNLFKRDRRLEELVIDCISTSTEITATLDKFEGRSFSSNLFDNVQKSGLSMYKKRELRDLAFRLQAMQTQVSSHLLDTLREQQQNLGQTLRKFVDSAEALEKELSPKIDEMIQLLTKLLRNKSATDPRSATWKRGWSRFLGRAHLNNDDDAGTSSKPAVSKRATPLTRHLQHIVAYYLDRMSSLIDKKREAMLQQLHFDLLKEREFSIVDAHEKTFNWIFQHDSSINFAKWLQKDGNIYWVAGKAGSGKSTLMKFLKHHPTTKRLLLQWAGIGQGRDSPAELIIADYYFWSLGTVIQKSQQGLFRSLLIQILKRRPDLMPIVLANRWFAPYPDSFGVWSSSELLQALCIVGTLQFPRLRICVFIDGLDESGDDHKELLQSIWKIGSCPNYKICVSSREWLDFSEAFQSSPWKLHLQDLTNQDIKQYIRDVLGDDARFRRLQTRDRDAALDLISSITARSQGVFLWVFLVVRSLLRGPDSEETAVDLQQRLEGMPSDLLEYFDHLLAGIDEAYKRQVVRLLLIMSYAESSFPLFTFYFFHLEDDKTPGSEPLPLLRHWPDVDTVEVEAMASQQRQLIAQCRDLVSISQEPNSHALFSERAGFAHRTVSDYVCTTSIRPKLLDMAGAGFDPRKVLFAASLGQVRSTMHLSRYRFMRLYIRQWFLECLYYAYQCEVAGHAQSRWLDDLEAIVAQHFRRWGFSDAMHNIIEMPHISSFVELTAKFDLLTYVEEKLPGCSAAKLDQVVPQWRRPCYIGQPPNLEVTPKGRDGSLSWRLGVKYRKISVDGGGGGHQDASPTALLRRKTFFDRILGKVGTLSRADTSSTTTSVGVKSRDGESGCEAVFLRSTDTQ